jgi:hypothetical protein
MMLPRRVVRAAAAMKSLLTMLCGVAILATSAMLLDAATLQAQSVNGADISATRDAHHAFIRSLAGMLGQCEGVLALRDERDGAETEVVVWLDDSHDVGRVNADELAVVRHSPLFQTVTLYSASDRSDSGSPALGAGTWAGAAKPSFTDAVVTLAEIAAPGATDRWRSHPAVGARVLATGISCMSIEPAHPGTDRALSLFRVRLTWDAESSDGAESASAVVEAGRRRIGALQEYKP